MTITPSVLQMVTLLTVFLLNSPMLVWAGERAGNLQATTKPLSSSVKLNFHFKPSLTVLTLASLGTRTVKSAKKSDSLVIDIAFTDGSSSKVMWSEKINPLFDLSNAKIKKTMSGLVAGAKSFANNFVAENGEKSFGRFATKLFGDDSDFKDIRDDFINIGINEEFLEKIIIQANPEYMDIDAMMTSSSQDMMNIITSMATDYDQSAEGISYATFTDRKGRTGVWVNYTDSDGTEHTEARYDYKDGSNVSGDVYTVTVTKDNKATMEKTGDNDDDDDGIPDHSEDPDGDGLSNTLDDDDDNDGKKDDVDDDDDGDGIKDKDESIVYGKERFSADDFFQSLSEFAFYFGTGDTADGEGGSEDDATQPGDEDLTSSLWNLADQYYYGKMTEEEFVSSATNLLTQRYSNIQLRTVAATRSTIDANILQMTYMNFLQSMVP